MTSQKTIERCRAKVKELEETNATLLHNNVVMAESNKKLREENKELMEANERARKNLETQETTIAKISKQRNECKRKCEIALSEKDRLLQEKERRLAASNPVIEHLKVAQWFHREVQLPDGQIEIIHTVKFQ